MKRLLGCLAVGGSIALVTGCGRVTELSEGMSPPEPSTVVVRARATMDVGSGVGLQRSRFVSPLPPATQPVIIVADPSARMTLDNGQFSIPPVTASVLNLGYLNVTALEDNSLSVCGPGGNQKCTTALLRVYTQGVGGPGVWNAADGYGAPLITELTTPLTVGLGPSAAITVSQIALDAGKRILRLSDFNPAPQIYFKADFSSAGSGTFSTTIVVEYALAP